MSDVKNTIVKQIEDLKNDWEYQLEGIKRTNQKLLRNVLERRLEERKQWEPIILEIQKSLEANKEKEKKWIEDFFRRRGIHL